MPKVLIIDDDPQLRTLLTKIFSARNFEVSVAKDGIEGLDRAKSDRPDLIILDIIMPGMDGFTVAQQIRDDRVCSAIPIMVLTAFATKAAQAKAMDAGVDTFLTKPLDFKEVLKRADELIGSRGSPAARTTPTDNSPRAQMISVHSLSGGLGCTSLAINLAYALHETWCLPTLLLDGDFSAGQIALNLNWFEAISWSDVLRAASKDAIPLVLEDPAISFDAELHVLASPHDPTDADLFSARVVGHGLKQFESRYEYIIADPAHDLRKCTVELLRNSDKILYLLSSDSTSLQLAKKALDAYATLGFGPERVELILVDWRLKNPAEVREVESIIGRTLLAHIPYSGKFNVASKRGLPLYKAYPAHPVSTLAKDLAFHLSKQSHKDGARIAPEPANGVPRPQQAPVKHNGSQRGAANSLLRRIGLTI